LSASKTSRATGYEVMISPNGSILQAGMPSRPFVAHHDPKNVMGVMVEATVLKVYYADEDTRCGWTGAAQRAVTADVRTKSSPSRVLARVPVLQLRHGLWDADIWVPREATQDIEGGQLSDGGSVPATPAENTDSDEVLIGFIDNNPLRPVILPFTLGHPKSNVRATRANGCVRELRFQGTVLGWDQNGDFRIDTAGVAKPQLGAAGAQVPNPGFGSQTLTAKSAAGAVLSLKIDASTGRLLLGESATEPLVCGTLLVLAVNALIDAIKALKTAGSPTTQTVDPASQQQLEAAKAAFTAALSTLAFTKKDP
jgi:hypothetical protein